MEEEGVCVMRRREGQMKREKERGEEKRRSHTSDEENGRWLRARREIKGEKEDGIKRGKKGGSQGVKGRERKRQEGGT